MIELFIVSLTIYVIGLAAFYGMKGFGNFLFGSHAKPLPTNNRSAGKNTALDGNANVKPEEKHISEEDFHRPRKRYLQRFKADYYDRGEGDKWEEMMKETEDIIRKYD